MTTGDRNYEFQLGLKLKELSSQKAKNTEEHAIEVIKVLRSFGLHYRKKSPDKISLIQSATFFNIALARLPNNLTLITDLQELCSHVLQLANAKRTDADLIAISADVKSMLEEMRKFRDDNMKAIHHAASLKRSTSEELLASRKEKMQKVKELYIVLTKRYGEVVTYISNQCEQIMGPSPIKYNISGKGSLIYKKQNSRGFRHIVILEEGTHKLPNYPEIERYFQWFSTLFQIIVCNLRETTLTINIRRPTSQRSL